MKISALIHKYTPERVKQKKLGDKKKTKEINMCNEKKAKKL